MPASHRLTCPAVPESLEDVREFIREHCAGSPRVTDEVLYDLQLAVDEACTNIISHGYDGLEPGSITVDLDVDPQRIVVSITDSGHAFDPGSAPAPDILAPLEDREPGGFGLFFIRNAVDEMDYRVTEDGNRMTLTKYLTDPAGGPR